MTISEALKSTINFPLPANTYSKALIDADLEGDAEYTSSGKRAIDLAAAGLLLVLLTSADIKEGDFARTLPDRNQLLVAYSAICKRWGVPNLIVNKPTIRGVQVW